MNQDTSFDMVIDFLRKKRAYIITLVVVLALIIGGLFVYSHGVVDTSSDAFMGASLSIRPIDDISTDPRAISRGRSVASSGTYELAVSFSDGSGYSKYITVGHFLKRAIVSLTKTSIVSTRQVAAEVSGDIIASGNDYYSIDGGTLYKHSSSNPSGSSNMASDVDSLSGVDSCVHYRESQELCLVRSNESDGSTLRTAVFTPSNAGMKTLTQSPELSLNSYLIAYPDMERFIVYDTDNLSLYVFSNTGASPIKITLKKRVAIGDNQPLITFSNISIIIAYGKNYEVLSGTKSANNRATEYTIETYDFSGNSKNIQEISQPDMLQSISVNSNDSYLFTVSGSLFVLYKIGGTGNYTVAFSSSGDAMGDSGWLDEKTLFYVDGTTSIQAISIRDSSTSYPIFYDKNVSISSVYSSSGKLFMTAYYASDSLQTAYGFVVQPGTDISQKERILLEKFPYSTDYFKMAASNEIVYIYPTRSFYLENQSRVDTISSANQYLQKYLPGEPLNTTLFP